MNLKQAILQFLDRDALKNVMDDLELDGADRRSVEEMAAKVSRSHRATPEALLQHLSELQVKSVCESLGLPPTGRRAALIKVLLRIERRRRQSTPATGDGPSKGVARQPRHPAAKKEPPRMSGKAPSSEDSPSLDAPIRLPDPPPGTFRIRRTELVWPGKYNEDGTLKEVPRVNLPFQVIETVNESRVTRERSKGELPGLFSVYDGKEGDTFEAGWRNKLIWGDNLLVMGALLEKFA